MADKSFGVDQLDILGTGTPTISAPNQLNLDAHTVAISTSVTVGEGMSAVNISATGISTIAQPANSNPMANWTITNNSNSAYRFTGPGQSGSDDNPDLYLVRGHRYIFKHNATTNHPIQIRVSNGGAAYTDGVTYSNTGNNTTTDGNNLIINLQHDAPARLFYQCTAHGSMVGNIYTVGGPQVISGVVTATTFSGSGASLTNLPAANLTGTLPAISGANLTSLPAQATIANNADNRVITGGSGVNLNGESNFTWTGSSLQVTAGTGNQFPFNLRNDFTPNSQRSDLLYAFNATSNNVLRIGSINSNAGITLQSTRANDSSVKHNLLLNPDGGKIGINEASPQQQLHVHEDTIYNGILINGNVAPRLAFARTTTTTGEWSVGIDGTNGNNFAINSSNDNSNNKIIISSSQISLYGDVSVPNGNIVMGNTRGIDFSATSDAAGKTNELLNDYEEGTWTPEIKGTTGAGTASYNNQVGRYLKIGNWVYLTWVLGWSSGSAGGEMRTTGFPFTPATNCTGMGSVMFNNVSIHSNVSNIATYIGPGNDYCYFYTSRSSSGWITVNYSSSGNLIANVSFRTA